MPWDEAHVPRLQCLHPKERTGSSSSPISTLLTGVDAEVPGVVVPPALTAAMVMSSTCKQVQSSGGKQHATRGPTPAATQGRHGGQFRPPRKGPNRCASH